MAIAHTLLDTLNTSDNITNYTAPDSPRTVTLPANELILMAILASRSASAVPPTSITTNGGTATWVMIDQEDAGVMSCSVWRTMVATAQAGCTFTLNHSGAGTGQMASIVAFSGVDTSGTNGSGAIGNIAASVNGTGTSSSITIATVDTGNAGYGAIGHIAAEATTHGMANELHDLNGSAPNRGFCTEYGISDSVVDFSWATSSAFRHIAFEIVAGATGGLPIAAWRRRGDAARQIAEAY